MSTLNNRITTMNKKTFLSGDYFTKSTLKLDGLGEVTVRELSAYDLSQIQMKEVTNMEAAAYFVALCTLDDKGELMFSEKDIKSILFNLKPSTLQVISEEILKISNLGTDDEGES